MYLPYYLGNVLTVPSKYVTLGVDGDLGIVVGSENEAAETYVAKSSSCTFLQSNNRPIWGMIVFNLNKLRYDQVGFQQQTYVAVSYFLFSYTSSPMCLGSPPSCTPVTLLETL